MTSDGGSWVSLADIVATAAAAQMSAAENSDFARLAQAITHALTVARNMPTTLDARARALVVTKLQEAEHWSFELLRVTDAERNG